MMILALIATLAVATTNAGDCVTTQDQYATVLRTREGPGQTGSRTSTKTSDPGKACMTYDEVSQLKGFVKENSLLEGAMPKIIMQDCVVYMLFDRAKMCL